ncbi:hypothetical protein Tsubulata_009431 [Turnera subulata]|uniref:Uncharacterized protein n=1 Tax=Turnera subulata TaxID=218843 RepID=A0A9Q0G2A1_9ROSI|nr:hypothetical protein Tsubulata_009431 [Turnera subulata]
MGSLMSGWDSHVPDPKSVKYMRNWSLTKEEIEAFWKLKKKTEEEHLEAISSLSVSIQVGAFDNGGANFQRSRSVPPARRIKTGFMENETEANLEEMMKKTGWWTRSNWAFLNEPPVLERSSNTYTSQFHIANLSNSKGNHGIITS